MEILGKVSEENKHFQEIECLLWFDGHLFSGADDGFVKIWTEDLKLVKAFKAHEYAIMHMVGDDSNKSIYTGSNDSLIKQWKKDEITGEWIHCGTLEGHQEAIRRLCLSGGKLFSGDDSGELRIWENGKLLGICGFVEEIWDLFVKDGKFVYTVRDKDLIINELTSFVNQSGGKQEEEIKMDRNFDSTFRLIGGDNTRWCVRGAIRGRSPFILTEDSCLCLTETEGMNISLYDIKEFGNFPKLGKLEGHKMIINVMTGTKDKLYSGGYDKKVIAWDLKEKKLKSEVDIGSIISALALNDKGRLFVAGEGGYIWAIKC